MKSSTLLGAVLLILLSLALLPYAQSYVNDLKANPDIPSTSKALIGFIPTLWTVFAVVLAGALILKALGGKR